MPSRPLLLVLTLLAAVLVGAALLLPPTHPPGQATIDRSRLNVLLDDELTDLTLAVPAARSAAAPAVADNTTGAAFGGLALRPLNAVLVHPRSGQPIAHLEIALVDSNRVLLDITSDADGRVRSASLLMAGPLDLFVRPGRSLQLSTDPPPPAGRLSGDYYRSLSYFKTLDAPQQTILLYTGDHIDVTHGASGLAADAPDIWRITTDRRLSLHLTGTDPSLLGLRHHVYVTAGTQPRYKRLEPEPREDLVDAEWLIVIPHALDVNGWRIDQLDKEGGQRRLHVVETSNTTVAVGSVRVGRIPDDRMLPLEVNLTPLTSADLPDLNTRFGKPLGEHIRALILGGQARIESNAHAAVWTGIAVEGTVRSQSGQFRGPLRIRALPSGPRLTGAERAPRKGEAEVVWSEDGVGHFVIENLDATTYQLTPRAKKRPITRPARAEVMAPVVLPPGSDPVFLILDELEMRAVSVSARSTDGTWLGSFRASLTARFDGLTISHAAVAAIVTEGAGRPQPTTVARAVPIDADIEVTVTLAGYEPTALTQLDFALEDGVFHALATLRENAWKQRATSRERDR